VERVSRNGSVVEGSVRKVETRNGMCRRVLQSGAALKAIVRGESARSDRRCTVCDGLEVHTFSSNHHYLSFDHCHQCSSN
jgi:hypothetical protein